jgi:hypothetical protein
MLFSGSLRSSVQDAARPLLISFLVDNSVLRRGREVEDSFYGSAGQADSPGFLGRGKAANAAAATERTAKQQDNKPSDPAGTPEREME